MMLARPMVVRPEGRDWRAMLRAIPLEARVAAYLYWAGFILVALSLVVPHDSRANVPALLVLIAIAAAAGAFFFTCGQWLPPFVYQVFTALASGLIAGLLHFGAGAAGAYSIFYLWVVLYAFYFFELRAALVQLAIAAGVLAAVLFIPVVGGTATDALNPPVLYWLVMVGGFAVSGTLTKWLTRLIRQTARQDVLTGAINRRAWDSELSQALRAHSGDRGLAVALIDLDHFRIYNHQYGHRRGDELLKELADRWSAELGGQGLLARYGGEEFGLILPGFQLSEAVELLERFRRAMAGAITFSAGVATCEPGESPESVMTRVDAALYEAKDGGRNRSVAAPAAGGGEDTKLDRLVRWTEPVLTLVGGETGMDVAFQPIVRLTDRTILAIEALARPHGLPVGLSVDGLFAAAERMGVIREVDERCQGAALRAAAGLSEQRLLFLNVSVAGLLEGVPNPGRLVGVAAANGISADHLVLEITERETVTSLDRLQATVAAYRAEGIAFAVDDVGEGHSALELLMTVRPEFIKISRKLTVAPSGDEASAVVAAVLTFARLSGASVIAEGIESAEMARRCSELGIEFGQGYFIGVPAPFQVDGDAGPITTGAPVLAVVDANPSASAAASGKTGARGAAALPIDGGSEPLHLPDRRRATTRTGYRAIAAVALGAILFTTGLFLALEGARTSLPTPPPIFQWLPDRNLYTLPTLSGSAPNQGGASRQPGGGGTSAQVTVTQAAAGAGNGGSGGVPPPPGPGWREALVVIPVGPAGQALAVGLVVLPFLCAIWLLLVGRTVGAARAWGNSGLRLALASELGISPRELAALPPTAMVRLRSQVTVDELTGVLRRAAGVAALEREIARARRYRTRLCVAFVDVDGLKKLNDSEGHGAGDLLLKDVALVLHSRLRAEDVVFRYGGDEFVCVLPGAGRVAAERLFEQMLAAARRKGRSFSHGVTEYEPGDDAVSLLARADAELYELRRRRRARGEDPGWRDGNRPAIEIVR